jgi:hypothetical protein
VLEAGVAPARAPRGLRVNLVQVAEHGLDGSVEAVEVEPVEADLCCARGQRVVVGAQPLDELDDDRVAPHPRREALEAAERRARFRVVRLAAHVAVDAVRVGPVGLDRDGRETPLRDEPLRDLGALAVELVRAVRSLAQQREPRLAHRLQQRVVVRARALQHVRRPAHHLRRRPRSLRLSHDEPLEK